MYSYLEYNISMIDKIKYAYLAGIIDGEGCVSIRKCPQGKNIYFKPMVEVGMADRQPIELLCSSFSNNSVWFEVPKNEGKWRPVHKWRVTGSNVIPVLKKTLPYLLVKKKQALLCLKCCKLILKRGGKFTSQEEKTKNNKERSILFNLMYSLNHPKINC